MYGEAAEVEKETGVGGKEKGGLTGHRGERVRGWGAWKRLQRIWGQ